MPEDNILLILGRLEGKMDSYRDSKLLQDARINKLEDELSKLFWKVAAISGAIASGASYLTAGLH